MAIKISGSTIIDDGRQLVNVGVSTISALSVSGNINANGNIIGDSSTNISGISSVTATSYFGNGENLTGVGFNFVNILSDKFKYVLSNCQPIFFFNIILRGFKPSSTSTYLYFILYININKDKTKVIAFANIIGKSDIVIP